LTALENAAYSRKVLAGGEHGPAGIVQAAALPRRKARFDLVPPSLID